MAQLPNGGASWQYLRVPPNKRVERTGGQPSYLKPTLVAAGRSSARSLGIRKRPQLFPLQGEMR
jgi:hypothetical protein